MDDYESFSARFVTCGTILGNTFPKIRLYPHMHKCLPGTIDLKTGIEP